MKNWKTNAQKQPFIASYSGGKDSTLALYKAMQQGTATGLIIMLEEEGKRSRSHGMPPALIHAQAEALQLPVYTIATSWEGYEQAFMTILSQAKEDGANVLVTGDLDVPEHGCWHDRVTKQVGLKLSMPLWEMDHVEVVREFIDTGFKTILVTVNLSLGMREEDLGRELTHCYVDELITRGIDPCGEGGEFHTTVLAGPIFSKEIAVKREAIIRDGDYAFLPLTLA